MTIDGIDIATMGLHLSYLDGHLSQPARKKNLQDFGFTAKDIVFEAKEPVIDLVGYYATKGAILSAMTAFTALVKSETIHAFNMGGHLVSFNGVITDGVKVDLIKTMLKIKFKVTVIGEIINIDPPVVSEWDYEGVLVAGSRGSRGWIRDWTGSITPTPVQVEGLPECTGILTLTTDFILRLWVQESTYTEKAANEIEINGVRYVLEADGSFVLENNIFTEGESYVIKLK